MKRPSRNQILSVTGLALVSLFIFRGPLGLTNAGKSDPAGHASLVTAATAQIRDVPVYAQTIGTVVANATVQVRARIDGEIVETPFREGQIVHKGDVLFRIDRAPYEAALRAAEANLQRDQAQLSNAERELSRANELSKKGYASAQARDTANADMKALAGSVAADQAAVDQANLQLGYTEIRSPIDGKTGPILVDAGNLIKANDASALVVVTQVQPVKISFSLAQQNLPQLQAQLKDGTLEASLHVHDLSGKRNEPDPTAPVNFIGNSVTTSTGTIELRATYENPDLRFVPGEYVDVRVRLVELKATVTVPREAVNTGQDGLYVFVIGKDNKVALRKIDVLYQGDDVAAIGKGLDAGERVVTDGQLRLLPGATVKIVEDKVDPKEQPAS